MERREFLIRVTIAGVSMPLLVREIGCGNNSTSPAPNGSSNFASTPDATGHGHTITIPDGDLSGGSNHDYISTTAAGHNHTVSIEAADFTDLNRGCRLTKISSPAGAGSHTHVWEIRYADKVNDITRTSLPDATGHSHDVTVIAGDINSAPASRDYVTTSAGHTHDVGITNGDFLTLQDCGTVLVTSSSAGTPSHTHQFSITPA